MDKWQALDDFWNSFEWPAYDENAVPDDAEMPYITYAASVSSFENPVPLTASLWVRSTGQLASISQKAEEIAERVSPYALQPLGGGEYIFITQGNPFAQRLADTDTTKRVFINLMAEYLSAH